MPYHNQDDMIVAPVEAEVGADAAPVEAEVTAEGTTTNNEGHSHKYYIDSAGSGTALTTYHPSSNNIAHFHDIIDGQVQSAASTCWPNCKSIHGYAGAPPHIHELEALPPSEEDTAYMKSDPTDSDSIADLDDLITKSGSKPVFSTTLDSIQPPMINAGTIGEDLVLEFNVDDSYINGGFNTSIRVVVIKDEAAFSILPQIAELNDKQDPSVILSDLQKIIFPNPLDYIQNDKFISVGSSFLTVKDYGLIKEKINTATFKKLINYDVLQLHLLFVVYHRESDNFFIYQCDLVHEGILLKTKIKVLPPPPPAPPPPEPPADVEPIYVDVHLPGDDLIDTVHKEQNEKSIENGGLFSKLFATIDADYSSCFFFGFDLYKAYKKFAKFVDYVEGDLERGLLDCSVIYRKYKFKGGRFVLDTEFGAKEVEVTRAELNVEGDDGFVYYMGENEIDTAGFYKYEVSITLDDISKHSIKNQIQEYEESYSRLEQLYFEVEQTQDYRTFFGEVKEIINIILGYYANREKPEEVAQLINICGQHIVEAHDSLEVDPSVLGELMQILGNILNSMLQTDPSLHQGADGPMADGAKKSPPVATFSHVFKNVVQWPDELYATGLGVDNGYGLSFVHFEALSDFFANFNLEIMKENVQSYIQEKAEAMPESFGAYQSYKLAIDHTVTAQLEANSFVEEDLGAEPIQAPKEKTVDQSVSEGASTISYLSNYHMVDGNISIRNMRFESFGPGIQLEPGDYFAKINRPESVFDKYFLLRVE